MSKQLRHTFNRSDWTGREGTLSLIDNVLTFQGLPEPWNKWRVEKVEAEGEDYSLHHVKFQAVNDCSEKHTIHYVDGWWYGEYVVKRESETPGLIGASKVLGKILWNVV